MSNLPESNGPIPHGDCTSISGLYTNSQKVVSNIASCQVSAKSPYCWPPNGTRICIDAHEFISTQITVFWPQGYYHSDSLLQTTFNPSTKLRTDVINDGRDTTVSLTWEEYDERGVAIPGVEHEKAVQMYFLERRGQEPDRKDAASGEGGVLHRGPVLVLVQTEDWKPKTTEAPNTTAAYPFADKVSAGVSVGWRQRGVGLLIVLLFFWASLLGTCSYSG